MKKMILNILSVLIGVYSIVKDNIYIKLKINKKNYTIFETY